MAEPLEERTLRFRLRLVLAVYAAYLVVIFALLWQDGVFSPESLRRNAPLILLGSVAIVLFVLVAHLHRRLRILEHDHERQGEAADGLLEDAVQLEARCKGLTEQLERARAENKELEQRLDGQAKESQARSEEDAKRLSEAQRKIEDLKDEHERLLMHLCGVASSDEALSELNGFLRDLDQQEGVDQAECIRLVWRMKDLLVAFVLSNDTTTWLAGSRYAKALGGDECVTGECFPLKLEERFSTSIRFASNHFKSIVMRKLGSSFFAVPARSILDNESVSVKSLRWDVDGGLSNVALHNKARRRAVAATGQPASTADPLGRLIVDFNDSVPPYMESPSPSAFGSRGSQSEAERRQLL